MYVYLYILFLFNIVCITNCLNVLYPFTSAYKRLQSISKRILNSGVNKSLAAGRSRGVTTLLPTKLTKDS